MSIYSCKGKEDVVYISNGILCSRKKHGIMSFVATWMNLEIIIVGKISQKEKDKYYMVALICRL